MDLEDAGATVSYLIRDRDAKFPTLFDQIPGNTGIHVVLTGVRMPRMNSLMERWMQTCRHALLDRTLIWNERHLDKAEIYRQPGLALTYDSGKQKVLVEMNLNQHSATTRGLPVGVRGGT